VLRPAAAALEIVPYAHWRLPMFPAIDGQSSQASACAPQEPTEACPAGGMPVGANKSAGGFSFEGRIQR
jgi:hypothetical protein